MAKLNDVKPKVAKITLSDGVEREIKFTLNAMAELEDRYGSIDKAFEALNNNSMKAIRFVLWAGLAHSDEGLTEQQVGNLIDMVDMEDIIASMSNAFNQDLPDDVADTAAAKVRVLDPNASNPM